MDGAEAFKSLDDEFDAIEQITPSATKDAIEKNELEELENSPIDKNDCIESLVKKVDKIEDGDSPN